MAAYYSEPMLAPNQLEDSASYPTTYDTSGREPTLLRAKPCSSHFFVLRAVRVQVCARSRLLLLRRSFHMHVAPRGSARRSVCSGCPKGVLLSYVRGRQQSVPGDGLEIRALSARLTRVHMLENKAICYVVAAISGRLPRTPGSDGLPQVQRARAPSTNGLCIGSSRTSCLDETRAFQAHIRCRRDRAMPLTSPFIEVIKW